MGVGLARGSIRSDGHGAGREEFRSLDDRAVPVHEGRGVVAALERHYVELRRILHVRSRGDDGRQPAAVELVAFEFRRGLGRLAVGLSVVGRRIAVGHLVDAKRLAVAVNPGDGVVAVVYRVGAVEGDVELCRVGRVADDGARGGRPFAERVDRSLDAVGGRRRVGRLERRRVRAVDHIGDGRLLIGGDEPGDGVGTGCLRIGRRVGDIAVGVGFARPVGEIIVELGR